MEDNSHNKYEILRNLALSGVDQAELAVAAETALQKTAELIGLQAAAVYLWDQEMTVRLAVAHATSGDTRRRLTALEEELFANLRKERNLLSAYMSFGGSPPVNSFTLPLRHGDSVFGAVIGLQEGQGAIVTESIFLEAFTAAMSLYAVADGAGAGKVDLKNALDKERIGAIVETAVTVNHEINNPLTAILGNVQLLLMKGEELDPKLQEKLKTIESAALKIQDFTQRLLQVTTPRTVEYADGTSMLDLSGESDDQTGD